MWRSACRDVQREAELLEVDGCWHLFYLHETGEERPSEHAERAKALIETHPGGGNLGKIKTAADSLLAWASENPPRPDLASLQDPAQGIGPAVAESPTTPTKKSKRSTERGEGQVKLIAALSKHHKYSEGGCLNLEAIGNNELARLAKVDKSTASDFFNNEFNRREKGGYAKYRVICRDAGRLADSLKALAGEFSPYDLFGQRPPGEGERNDE